LGSVDTTTATGGGVGVCPVVSWRCAAAAAFAVFFRWFEKDACAVLEQI
jgi:hypothetical protein